MDDDLDALARCVGDIDTFAAEHWGRRPLVRRGVGSFTDLLDLQAIDALLTSTARRPTFRMVKDGSPVPPTELTMSVRLGGTTLDDAADVSRIGDHLAAGATLVLQGLQRTWPPLVRFCRALERAASHAVQANAYLTPPAAAGLAAHADAHDVIVLQVVGAKAWHIDGLGHVDLAAGDVVYLPTGTTHHAQAQHELSLHLTIGLLTDTYRSVAHRALADAPGLDASLPLGWARSERRHALSEGVHAAISAAAAHLAASEKTLGDLVDKEVARARTRRRPLLSGHLASLLTPIDDRTVVRRRPDNHAIVHVDGNEIVVQLVDRSIRMPGHAAAAVAALGDGGETAVAELPGLDEPGRAVLARRLVREGLLEVVDAWPSPSAAGEGTIGDSP